MKKIIFLIVMYLTFFVNFTYADLIWASPSYSISEYYPIIIILIIILIWLYIFFIKKHQNEKDKKTETNNKEL